MKNLNKIVALSGIIFLSGCASAPKFIITDNPETVRTFDVQTKTEYSSFKGVSLTSWVEAKAAMISKEKGCTHFRQLSSDTVRHYNAWFGTRSQTDSKIFECVDISNHKNVITSKDRITINDGRNIGNSSRIYLDIKPIIFRHRELIEKINLNEKKKA